MEWQPIETGPKDGRWILLHFHCAPDGVGVFVGKWASPKGFDFHWCIEGRGTPGIGPSHWMPLPDPPH